MLQEIKDAVEAKKLMEWVLDNYFKMNGDQKRSLMLELAFMIDFTDDTQGMPKCEPWGMG